MAVLNCPRCGVPTAAGMAYCPHCGASQAMSPGPPPVTARPLEARDWIAISALPAGFLALLTFCTILGGAFGLTAIVLGVAGWKSRAYGALAQIGFGMGTASWLLNLIVMWFFFGSLFFDWSFSDAWETPGSSPAGTEFSDRWVPLSGDLVQGETVYILREEEKEPVPWARVIEKLSKTGEPVLFIEWVETGEREVMTQRKFYETPAAVTGMLYRPREP